jgi:RHS repeat-associated protein
MALDKSEGHPSLNQGYFPLPGGDTAVWTLSGLAYYRHADWLGSSRLATTSTGAMYSDVAYAPFGETYNAAGNSDLVFAGLPQINMPGLSDATNREYHAPQGRWPMPDPAGLAAADPANPQSWNRYAYVMNNPLLATDPDGLQQGLSCDPSHGAYSPHWCPTTYENADDPFGITLPGTVGNWNENDLRERALAAYWIVPALPDRNGYDFSKARLVYPLLGLLNLQRPGVPSVAVAPPAIAANNRLQRPLCTALQAQAAKLGGFLDNVSTTSGWIAFGTGAGTVLAGVGEGPTGGVDTPGTITLGGMTDFFGTVSVVSGGAAATLDSYAAGDTRAMWNFNVSQLANLAAKAAASRLPLVKPWADRIGDLAEQAADLALKAKEGCR